MPLERAVAEFDQISPVYDATREPLDAAAVRSIATALRGWGVHRLLEVGVGTGRIAGPLAAEGFEVTGVDASRRMLSLARAKGLGRLVRGSAYRLPFADRALDGALFVHVLHVLEDPRAALAEACRVTRRGAAALVRPSRPRAGPETERPNARRLVVEYLRREGVPVPERAGRWGGMGRERELLTAAPPDRLITISEEDVTEKVAEQLAMFERRASRWSLSVPPEQLARAVAAAREQVGDATRTYHRVRALAFWSAPPTAAASLPGSPFGTGVPTPR